MKITFISDTHTKHRNCELDLPGGDLLLHAGDFMNSGYHEIEATEFFDWFDVLDNYDTKVFIAGNHDRLMENGPDRMEGILTGYKNIDYLEDSKIVVNDINIYGSPWQPAFYDWAFNLPRNGVELQEKWAMIPSDVDILICHTMPFGHCDGNGSSSVGCELLRVRTDEIRPKIFIGGHIHSGYGYKFYEGTHFINAAVLNNNYKYTNKPLTVEWDPETNELEFI